MHEMWSIYPGKQNIKGITQINIDENGFTSVETGLVSVSTLSNIDVLWHHRMNQIDGSIEISKSILNNKHWSLFAGVDLGYNILTRHNGYFFDEQFKFVKTETVDDVPFSSNQGFLYGMNMCLEYQFQNFTIGLSPNISWRTGHLLENNFSYNLKNSQYGIQVRMYYYPTWESL